MTDLPSRIDAFAEQAKQIARDAIAERDMAVSNFHKALDNIAQLTADVARWEDEAHRLMADKAELLEGLKNISERKSDCGCKPCTGQCVSRESLTIKLDAIRDIASDIITKHSKGGENE